MKKRLGTAVAMLTAVCIGATFLGASGAAAHVVSWQRGEPRQVGYGRCAKGPCTKRASWSTTKPHRHVGSRVIIELGPHGVSRR